MFGSQRAFSRLITVSIRCLAIWLCSLLTLVTVGYTCYARLSKSSVSPAAVTLILSGGEYGYLKPCGCSEGQLGGFARRDSLLTQMQAQSTAVIPIANGNLIADASPQSDLKADIGFFALADMGYVAYNLGERDLQLGIERFVSLSEQNRLPVVCANLYQGTSRVFASYVFHTTQVQGEEITIGIVGLISPTYAGYAQGDDLQILAPAAVLETSISELTATVDVIVCLFNGPAVEASVIQVNYPVIDVVVMTHESPEGALSSSVPQQQLVNTGIKGKSVRSVKIHRDVAGELVVEAPQRHLLDEQIPDSRRMTELLSLYPQMVLAENLAQAVQPKQRRDDARFIGTAACKTCHRPEGTSWKKTKHAQAYHTLEVAGHQADPECLTCHTVGFGFSTGFLSLEKTPNHLGVGCESCHGAGSAHAESPQEDGYGAVTESVCFTCHTVENSPQFDMKVYFPHIVHSSEEHP